MKLAGSRVLVTGSARRLGRAIALGMANRGCKIALHYGSSGEEAQETAEEIRRLGVEVRVFAADLTDPDAITELFRGVEEAFGGLDILVNSAASFERRDLLAIDLPQWEEVLALNLRAPFLCLQRAAELMATGRPQSDADSAGVVSEPGLVVNISDLSGLQAWKGYAHHGVSKAGLLHLTKVAASELAPSIRVNAVVPGAILPPPGMDPGSDWWQSLGERIPRGRTGEPQEVAAAVIFLAENDFVTGQTIVVDGGEHLLVAGR
jgi:pteridine reductase